MYEILCDEVVQVSTETIYSGTLWAYVIFPLLIVIARITDVTFGTLRIILLSKGLKHLAPVIGFFESLIWILVAARIITDLTNPITYIAYALGYALGTYVGIAIEGKLSLGKVVVRAFISKESTNLENVLRENNFGLTTVDATGRDGHVRLLFIVINRKELENCVAIIRDKNPNAFCTIEDIQSVNAGYFPEYGNNKFGRSLLLGKNK
jgi:uncharacterized protein YebE (UPF0316 family)